MRALLIDDDEAQVGLLKIILTQQGCDVITASGGRQGLDLFRTSELDFVVCDVRMEDIDGIEFLKLARKLKPDVPVLLISGQGVDTALFGAVKHEAFDFLPKPIDKNALALAVRRAGLHRRASQERNAWATRLQHLEQFLRRLNAATGLDELLEVVDREIPDLLDVRLYSLFRYEPSSRRLRLLRSNHITQQSVEVPITGDQGPMSAAVSRGAPVVVDDFAASPYKQDDERADKYRQRGSVTVPLSAVALTLHSEGEVVGVLNLNDSRGASEGFNDADVRFFAIVGEHLASAIRARERTEALNRALEEVIEQQQKLVHTEKLSLLGELAAGIMHEIGQPLMVISGTVDKHLDRLSDGDRPDPAQLRVALETVQAMTHRIARIRDMLGRFARHPRDSVPEPVAISEVVDASVALLRAQLERSRVRVAVEIEPGLPYFTASRVKLEQAVVNLLMNAREALEGVDASERRVFVSARKRGDALLLAVRDTGPGVPRELRQRIFEPLFSTKLPGEGMGLGLSVTKRIVEELGGTIQLEADEGTGSTFTLVLPVSAGA